jgi:hypothetical protein
MHLVLVAIEKIYGVPEPDVHLPRIAKGRNTTKADDGTFGLQVLEAGTTELHAPDLVNRVEAIQAVGLGAILPTEEEVILPTLIKVTAFGLVIPGEDIAFFKVLDH